MLYERDGHYETPWQKKHRNSDFLKCMANKLGNTDFVRTVECVRQRWKTLVCMQDLKQHNSLQIKRACVLWLGSRRYRVSYIQDYNWSIVVVHVNRSDRKRGKLNNWNTVCTLTWSLLQVISFSPMVSKEGCEMR